MKIMDLSNQSGDMMGKALLFHNNAETKPAVTLV